MKNWGGYDAYVYIICNYTIQHGNAYEQYKCILFVPLYVELIKTASKARICLTLRLRFSSTRDVDLTLDNFSMQKESWTCYSPLSEKIRFRKSALN